VSEGVLDSFTIFSMRAIAASSLVDREEEQLRTVNPRTRIVRRFISSAFKVK
jgi:hypothetical protein